MKCWLLLTTMAGCTGYRALAVDGTGSDDSGAPDSPTDSGTPTLTTVVDPRLRLEDVLACESPAASVTYTEVGATWGLTQADTLDTDDETSGGALAVYDYDHDGDLDVIVGFKSENVVTYRNEGSGAFTRTNLAEVGCFGTALNVADMDGDGWEDLIIGKPPSILQNVEGAFDAEHLVSLTDVDNGSSVELSPADVDGDGLADLYSVVQTNDDEFHEDGLFMNAGGLVFEEVPNGVPDDPQDGKGFDVVWWDEDGDGDQDAYVSNDMGNLFGENVLWRNDDGVLVNANGECQCGVAITGMGVDVGDVDRDGNMDLFLTHGTGQVLLQRLSNGVYYDNTDASGANIPEMSWGAVFFDRDNDGDQDILVAMGQWVVGSELNGAPGDGIGLLDQVDGSFTDVAPSLGLEGVGGYRSVVAADFNADGVLDFVAGDVQLRPEVYLSDSCTADGWIEVWAPAGTRVAVSAGADRWVDEVMTDSGRGAAGPSMVHIGLGAHQTVSRVELVLPGGEMVVATGVIEARRVVRYVP